MAVALDLLSEEVGVNIKGFAAFLERDYANTAVEPRPSHRPLAALLLSEPVDGLLVPVTDVLLDPLSLHGLGKHDGTQGPPSTGQLLSVKGHRHHSPSLPSSMSIRQLQAAWAA